MGHGLCPRAPGGPHQFQGVPADRSPLSPQEALHRELLLKKKMVILQELFSTLLQASEKSWQVPTCCTGVCVSVGRGLRAKSKNIPQVSFSALSSGFDALQT